MLFKRKLLEEIKSYLFTTDIIVIHGARQTGKTTLINLIKDELPQNQKYYFDLEDSRYKALFENGIESVISFLKQKGLDTKKGKIFIFVDEIQYLKNPSSFLKLTHDHFTDIKLIVTGSSSFEIRSKFKDSLVGRTVNFELFPLDFEEFLWFKKQSYNLVNLISNSLINEELLKFYKEYILFGGYPKIVLTENTEIKEKYLQQIIDTYIKSDIRDLANIRHVDKFNKLLHVLANQSGELVNIMELSNTSKIARQTIEDYLFILEQTYIIKLVQPFSGNIRSELFKTPKIFFYDTGIMNMLSKKSLPHNIDGSSFETAIFSDLIKYFGFKNLNHWRTKDKKEIDFILSLKGSLFPIEVKINASKLNYTPMKYFYKKYPTKKMFCISLEGDLQKNRQIVKNIFPWEIISEIN